MNDAITRTLDLLGREIRPAPEPTPNKAEFCRRFVAYMVKRAGFTHFDDDKSVEEYAQETAPTYWADKDQRQEGPEECADADMSYWGEE
ncbi:hypothetical protein [Methylobacterium haplocladii]|uniref:Uncharacterized protein n=1 Tax=Methylobacterium haplocladii TaxID=1176176 RepID=A0A512IS28_9HYPH|nr:hypothetical protein [Methylobacterium haplocladii]GEP00512.1 hypothetical protein MHA02_28990 [Methylobacterium haplocladii]GJD85427.1 hypothetical protein HPGCJGGD_3316 [Methylobacterium haplocladii]GLS57812.1 hypothetical protein GCM10007887_04680 [Methylobacterium haplocladii]